MNDAFSSWGPLISRSDELNYYMPICIWNFAAGGHRSETDKLEVASTGLPSEVMNIMSGGKQQSGKCLCVGGVVPIN
eukprot:scaffold71207_cov37-Prasinocladus_malaysianus.AAC.1